MSGRKVTLEIPEGDYCEYCKFLEHYDFPLIDIMGNETGNRRSGYKCKLHNDELEAEDFGCYQKVKKSFWCKATDQERLAYGALAFLLFGFQNNGEKKED